MFLNTTERTIDIKLKEEREKFGRSSSKMPSNGTTIMRSFLEIKEMSSTERKYNKFGPTLIRNMKIRRCSVTYKETS